MKIFDFKIKVESKQLTRLTDYLFFYISGEIYNSISRIYFWLFL